jgi:hypothetical protein
MRRVLSATQRLWVIGTLLVALVVRALIPAGFMPATDRPLSFQVCPDGFPAQLLASVAEGEAHSPGSDSAFSAVDAMLAHAGPHHEGAPLAGAEHDASFAHAGHHHDNDGSHQQDAGGLLATGLSTVDRHHGGHDHSSHSSANAEHCVFAAAAGAFALAFLATFSAPAATAIAPDVPYASPVFEARRFHLPPPRGPPALS